MRRRWWACPALSPFPSPLWSLPPNVALPKSVPFWEMLHLPAQHFPAENASSFQPFQLTMCSCAPFRGSKPKRVEKSCFLGQGFRGTQPVGLRWGAAGFGHLHLDLVSLGHPCRGPGSLGGCPPPPPPAWGQEAVAGPLQTVPAIWLGDQRKNRLTNARSKAFNPAVGDATSFSGASTRPAGNSAQGQHRDGWERCHRAGAGSSPAWPNTTQGKGGCCLSGMP